MVKIPTISGATPIDDTSGLKPKIYIYDELIIAEAENVAEAVTKYLAKKPSKRLAPFNLEWSLKLHNEMFGKVWKWAGQSRKTQPNIGVAPYQISPELHNLFEDLKAWKDSEMPLIEQAARLHHRAVQIHPFVNGNGRWSRMLADIWLKQNGARPIAWPSSIGQESPIRAEYIAAVKKADKGSIESLLSLCGRYKIQ